MNTMFIIKGFFVLLSVLLSIVALVRLGKKKVHFQIFPDSIKKEYFKQARLMTVLNIIAVLLIFVAFLLIKTNYFFIVIISSMFLSANSLIQIYEDFGDENDENTK